nr:polysaccharide biosynthesis tyrosine autokinase [Pseudopontixanthobacter vadosimaris]
MQAPETRVSPLEYYAQVARRKWKLIAAIMLGFLLLGLVVTLLTTAQYRATTRVEISQIDTNVTNVESLDEAALVADSAYLQTQYELLESRSLAERVARAARLQRDPAFLEAYGYDEGAEPSARAVINILLRDISIEPVVASNLVDISYLSPNPELSARIANAWAKQFLEANLDRRYGANNQAREFVLQRLQEVRADLEQSERDLIDYATSQQLVTIGSSGSGEDGSGQTTRTLVSDELETLNSQLANATAARIAAESARADSASASSETLGSVAAFRRQLASAEAELARQSALLGDQHPTILSLRSQVAELSESIARETRRASGEARQSVAAARANESALRERIATLKSDYLGEQQAGVQYAILQREVTTNSELYNALLQQFKNLGAAGVGRNNMSIVDAAEAPTSPAEPNLFSNLLIFFALGGLAAGATVMAMESVDRGFVDTSSVQDELGLPLLGAIPAIKSGEPVEELKTRSSEIYEAYTTLRSNLSFLTSSGVPETIMLTSSRAAEGKSLSAFALSKQLADLGKRILLIDGDMRNSGIGKYLDVPDGRGLSSVLAGEELENHGIVSPAGQNFDLLPAGRVPPNAAHLLAGPALSKLLGELRQVYDHIIIDGPPILGLADVQEMARVTDGVLMVIEIAGSKRRAISQALARVQQSGARVLGLLMTKVPQDDLHYGYGYGYGPGWTDEGAAAR